MTLRVTDLKIGHYWGPGLKSDAYIEEVGMSGYTLRSKRSGALE